MAKKISKKLVALLLTAIMVMAMGVSAFAATTTYNVGVTLYKDEDRTSVSKGNDGIASVTAVYDDATDTYDITLTTQDITVLGFTGTLSSFSLYCEQKGDFIEASHPSTYTFVIADFPADELKTGKLIEGEFTTDFSIMGTKTGYLYINSMTAQ